MTLRPLPDAERCRGRCEEHKGSHRRCRHEPDAERCRGRREEREGLRCRCHHEGRKTRKAMPEFGVQDGGWGHGAHCFVVVVATRREGGPASTASPAMTAVATMGCSWRALCLSSLSVEVLDWT